MSIKKVSRQENNQRQQKQRNKKNLTNILIIPLFLISFLVAFKNNQEQIILWLTEVSLLPKSFTSNNWQEEITQITNSLDRNSSEIIPAINLEELSGSPVFEADYTHIDRAAQTIEYQGNSVTELANILTQFAHTEAEKARIIYSWIAYNVDYDIEDYLRGGFSALKPSDVLKTRKAVCGGYAYLYEALAHKLGLKVVVINGYAKGSNYIVGNSTDVNHGWNGVQIDGKWYLIDATWGAGYIENKQFIRQFNPYYFATPPEQFVYDHLPEHSQWQLLLDKFTKEQFESLPETSAQFFTTGLKFVSHFNHTIEADNRVAVTLTSPLDTVITARLKSGSNILPDTYTFVQKDGENILINSTFPQAGTYQLEIFAKKKNEQGLYPHALTYKIIAQSEGEQLPKTYSTLTENNGNLSSPLLYSLPKNRSVYFHITLDNAVEVQVINESLNQWNKLTRFGNTFSGNVFIGHGKIKVSARFPGDTTTYWSLAEYQ